jgi:hypothetical protein
MKNGCRELGLVQIPARQQVDAIGDGVGVEATVPSEFKLYKNMFTGISKLQGA